MYSLSSEIIEQLNTGCGQTAILTVTCTDGTTLTITESNIIQGSLTIDRCSVSGSKIELGSAIAAELDFKLYNFDGEFDDITFEGAEIYVQIGVEYDGEITYIPCGYFIVDEQPRNLSTITISALDRMVLLDEDVDWDTLTFPCTVSELIKQVCSICDVSVATELTGLSNYSYSIPTQPTEDIMTYRGLIQWCAGITGTCAFMNYNGSLTFSWYENSTGLIITKSERYSSDIYENAITISGIQITYTETTTDDDGNETEEEITYIAGTDTYCIDISENLLIQDNYEEVLYNIYSKVSAISYLPYEISTFAAPYFFPMDVISITDRNDEVHQSIITNVTYTLNSATVIKAQGETEQSSSYSSGSGLTAAETAALYNIRSDIAAYETVVANYLYAVNATIDNLSATYITVAQLSAIGIDVEYLTANTATIETLFADYLEANTAYIEEADVKELLADYATITELYAVTGTIEELTAIYASITSLEADTISVADLFAYYATITYVEANYVTTDTLATEIAYIEEAYIKSAEVTELLADYITSTELYALTGTIEELTATYLTVIGDSAFEGDVTINGLLTAVYASIGTVAADYISANTAVIDTIIADYISANTAEFYTIIANYISANTADIESIVSSYIITEYLTATGIESDTITVGDIFALYATIDYVESNYVTTETLDATTAYIEEAYIKSAEVTELLTDYATITELNAVSATISSLSTTYAEITFANVDVANVVTEFVSELLIAQGFLAASATVDTISVTNYLVGVGIIADYITAGTLDCTSITVANLSVGALTVDSINGYTLAGTTVDADNLEELLTQIMDAITTTDDEVAQALEEAGLVTTEVSALSSSMIVSIEVQYYLSTSSEYVINGSWSSTAPDWTEGTYIWTRNLITYGNGSTVYSDAVCITGNTGSDGSDGVSVASIVNYYMRSVSSDEYSLSYTDESAIVDVSLVDCALVDTITYEGWLTEVPEINETYRYLWNFEIVYYSDGSYTETTPCVIGVYGESGEDGQMLYATCSTAEDAAEKIATLISGELNLTSGSTVIVTFTYANTAASPTLNIENTGDIPIYLNGAAVSSSNEYYWEAGSTITFVYDGSYWVVSDAGATAAIATVTSIANGKSTTYFSDTAPSSDDFDLRENDIWFDTDDDNAMYMWDGTAWEKCEYGTSALAAACITTELLAAEAVTAAKIAAGTITSTEIAANTITAANILAGTITATEIDTDSIATAILSATYIQASTLVIGTDEDGNVVISDGKITAEMIDAETITGDMIVSNSITATQIAAGTITSTEIAANTITASNIAAGTITATELASGSVTAEKISVSDLYALGATIGGFTIGSTAIYSNYDSFASYSGNIYIGSSGISLGTTFSVTYAGAITATSGTIGAITLSSTGLYAYNSSYSSSYAGIYRPSTITTSSIAFFAGATSQTGTSAVFKVTYGGALTASSATITGTIYAGGGTIGGFTIGSTAIYSNYDSYASYSGNIYIGTSGISLGTAFAVTSAGALTASSATITGTIYASGGTIGGFTIGSSSIYTSSNSFADTSANIYIGSSGISLSTTFSVTQAGYLTATFGLIGAFYLGSTALYTSSSSFGTVSNNIYIGTSGISLSTTFSVTAAGAITATSGTIGAITLSSTGLYAYNSSYSSSYAGIYRPSTITTSSIAFFAGATSQTGTSATFYVTYGGTMYASNAEIFGTITTESGNYKSMLTSGNLYFYYNSTLMGTYGSTYWANDSSVRGVRFGMDYYCDFMSFSHKASADAESYTWFMYFDWSGDISGYSGALIMSTHAHFQSAPYFETSLYVFNAKCIYFYKAGDSAQGGYLYMSSSDNIVLMCSSGNVSVGSSGGAAYLYSTYGNVSVYSTAGNANFYSSYGYTRIGYSGLSTYIYGYISNTAMHINTYGSRYYDSDLSGYGAVYMSSGNEFNVCSSSYSICVYGTSTYLGALDGQTYLYGNYLSLFTTGNVSIYTTGGNITLSASEYVQVGTATCATYVVGSTIYMNGSAYSSDISVKNSITHMDDAYLDLLDRLTPRSFYYNWNSEDYCNGFIAQEVMEALEEVGITNDTLVRYNKAEGTYALDYNGFIPILVAAVKELRSEVAALQTELSALQSA